MNKLSIDDVRFRGRPLQALTREELTEALMQALDQLAGDAYSAVGGFEIVRGRFARPERDWRFSRDYISRAPDDPRPRYDPD